MEEDNKYWLKKEKRNCTFYGKGGGNWEHFIKECEIARGWFTELGKDEKERLERIWDESLDNKKGYILRKFCTKKEKVKKEWEEIAG